MPILLYFYSSKLLILDFLLVTEYLIYCSIGTFTQVKNLSTLSTHTGPIHVHGKELVLMNESIMNAPSLVASTTATFKRATIPFDDRPLAS